MRRTSQAKSRANTALHSASRASSACRVFIIREQTRITLAPPVVSTLLRAWINRAPLSYGRAWINRAPLSYGPFVMVPRSPLSYPAPPRSAHRAPLSYGPVIATTSSGNICSPVVPSHWHVVR